MKITKCKLKNDQQVLGVLKKKGCLTDLMAVVASDTANAKDNVVHPVIVSKKVDGGHENVYDESSSIDMYSMNTQQNGDEMTEDTSSTQENEDDMIEDININNKGNVVLRTVSSCMMDEKEESVYSTSPSIDMFTTDTQNLRNARSGAKRRMRLTKEYKTGDETFQAGSVGTVIEGTTRKDRKLKIKLDKDTEKKYRLIKETNLQLYTFTNGKEVVCLDETNYQSNSSNSEEDLSIEY